MLPVPNSVPNVVCQRLLIIIGDFSQNFSSFGCMRIFLWLTNVGNYDYNERRELRKFDAGGVCIMKYSFKSDYCELAHPLVLESLAAVGYTQFEGYGLDEFSLRAAELVRTIAKAPSADVHFLSGGTQANLIVISSALRPHEAVIAVESGHIFVHEAGAIEATGHKICTVSGKNGKLCAADVEAVINAHTDEHMVKPRLVYISQSSETGTVYSKAELSAISEVCQKSRLYLFVDGARLGAALNSHVNDLTYPDIAALADVFYIGGTKNGALFGEAVVICNDALKPDFRFLLKQKGALISKGAAIGAQFESLLKDGLFDALAQHSNAMALKMANGIAEAGYDFLYPVETNMLFPVFPASVVESLHGLYSFYDWQKDGDMMSLRLVTSWATPERIIDGFLADLSHTKQQAQAILPARMQSSSLNAH